MTRLTKGVLLLLLLSLPTVAVAQTPVAPSMMDMPRLYLAPFLGTTFSGDTTTNGTAVGVAGGWRSKSWWGVEGEVAATPNFFEQTGFLTSRSVTTGSANFLARFGSARMSVFGVAGYGLIRVDLAEAGGFSELKKTEPAFNFGAGAEKIWTNNVGVRGDIRYFRGHGNTDDDSNLFGLQVSTLHFWRASAALVVGF